MPLLEDLFYGQRDLANDRLAACAGPARSVGVAPSPVTVNRELPSSSIARPASRSAHTGQGRLLAASGVVIAVPSLVLPGHLARRPGREGRRRPDRRHDRPDHAEGRDRPAAVPARVLGARAAWQPETVIVGKPRPRAGHRRRRSGGRLARAIHQGLLPGYIIVEESSPVLRGRLRESAQLRRAARAAAAAGDPARRVHHGHPGEPDPADRLRADAASARVDDESQQMLRRLLRDFVDVTPLSARRSDPVWQPTRHQRPLPRRAAAGRARAARDLGRARTGGVAVNGFLLDMPRLFEDFVTVALREALDGTYGGRVDGQAAHHFDEAGRVRFEPDIVWQVGGSPVAVIDAKYKAEKPAVTRTPTFTNCSPTAPCSACDRPPGLRSRQRGPCPHEFEQSGVEFICHALGPRISPRCPARRGPVADKSPRPAVLENGNQRPFERQF